MDNIYLKTQEIDSWIINKYFGNNDLITIGDLISKIEELDADLDRVEEKMKDREKDIEDNFRRIDIRVQVGDE